MISNYVTKFLLAFAMLALATATGFGQDPVTRYKHYDDLRKADQAALDKLFKDFDDLNKDAIKTNDALIKREIAQAAGDRHLEVIQEKKDQNLKEQNRLIKKVAADKEGMQTAKEEEADRLKGQMTDLDTKIAAKEQNIAKAKSILAEAEALPADNPQRESTINLANNKIDQLQTAVAPLRQQRDRLAKSPYLQ